MNSDADLNALYGMQRASEPPQSGGLVLATRSEFGQTPNSLYDESWHISGLRALDNRPLRNLVGLAVLMTSRYPTVIKVKKRLPSIS